MARPELCVVGGRLGGNNESRSSKHWHWWLQVDVHLQPRPVMHRFTRILHTPNTGGIDQTARRTVMPWLHAPIFLSEVLMDVFWPTDRKNLVQENWTEWAYISDSKKLKADKCPISSDEVLKPRKARRRRTTPQTKKSVRVATALIGCISGLDRPSVRLLVCLCVCPLWALKSKRAVSPKWSECSQGREWLVCSSKVKVTGRQKLLQNDAYLASLFTSAHWTLTQCSRRVWLATTRRMAAYTSAHICWCKKNRKQFILLHYCDKYCPRIMPVQHSVNPSQLVQAVSCTQRTHKNQVTLTFDLMTLIFNQNNASY